MVDHSQPLRTEHVVVSMTAQQRQILADLARINTKSEDDFSYLLLQIGMAQFLKELNRHDPRNPDRPDDPCSDPGQDCLWRVVGWDPVARRFNLLLGLVRAPRRDIALTLALTKYGKYYTDIQIRGEPIPDLPKGVVE